MPSATSLRRRVDLGERRGRSSVGRASACHAEGRRFESGRPLSRAGQRGAVAQLVRAPHCHCGGRGFESLQSREALLDNSGSGGAPQGRWSGAVAQLGERCNRTAEVRGSTPLSSTVGDLRIADLREARVAELADAQDSGSCGGNPVRVQVPSRALSRTAHVLKLVDRLV